MNGTPIRSDDRTPPRAVPALVAVATPTASDRPPGHEPQPTRFAELLRQSRAEHDTPRAAPLSQPQTPTANEPGDADSEQSASDAAPSRPAGSTPRARGMAAKNTPGKASPVLARGAVAPGESEREGAVAGAPDAGPPTAPVANAVRAPDDVMAAATIAARGRGDAAQASAAADIHEAIASTEGEAEGTRPGHAGATRHDAIHARRDAALEAATGHASPIETSRTAAGTGADATFRAILGNTGRGIDAPAASTHAGDAGVAAASLAAAVGTPTAAEPERAIGAANDRFLATPINAPEFGAALGVHVSVLAKDGVQHAELHLNPAETGPVSIRIEVEGSSARVDFGADLAATREAIERGLPELACALRDAGLTLTGGGVSQHGAGARGRDGGDAPAMRPDLDRTGTAVSARAETARIVRRVAAGGVDLYA